MCLPASYEQRKDYAVPVTHGPVVLLGRWAFQPAEIFQITNVFGSGYPIYSLDIFQTEDVPESRGFRVDTSMPSVFASDIFRVLGSAFTRRMICIELCVQTPKRYPVSQEKEKSPSKEPLKSRYYHIINSR